MGQPVQSDVWTPPAEHIGRWRAVGELKHLSSPTKRNQPEIPVVVASEAGRAQTLLTFVSAGVLDRQQVSVAPPKALGDATTGGAGPARSPPARPARHPASP